MDNLAKKTFWSDAAAAGAVIGLVMVGFMFLEVFAAPGTMRTVLNILDFLALAGLIFVFAKRRSGRYSLEEGFGYAQSAGFIIATMLFVGFLYGLGYYFLLNSLEPQMMERFVNELVAENPIATPDVEAVLRKWLASPVFWIVIMMIGYVVYGGVLGLVLSAFVKRNPDVFGDNNSQNDNSDYRDE